MVAVEQQQIQKIKQVTSRTRSKLDEMNKFSLITVDEVPDLLNGFEFELINNVYVPLNIKDLNGDEIYLGDLKKISNGHPTSLATYYRWLRSETLYMKNHYHPHKEVFVVMKGQLDIVIGGRQVILKEGGEWEIPPFTPHKTIVYPNTSCCISWFEL